MTENPDSQETSKSTETLFTQYDRNIEHERAAAIALGGKGLFLGGDSGF